MSSKKCCVPGCLESGNAHPTLHLFPKPVETQRFNQWVLSIGGDILGLNNEYIYKHRRVCHAHFEEKFCCRGNKLSNIAVPSRNLRGSTSLPIFTHAERRPLRQIQAISELTPSTSLGPDPIFSCFASPTRTSFILAEDIRNISSHEPFLRTEERQGSTSLPIFTHAERRPLSQLQDLSEPTPSTSSGPDPIFSSFATPTRTPFILAEDIRNISSHDPFLRTEERPDLTISIPLALDKQNEIDHIKKGTALLKRLKPSVVSKRRCVATLTEKKLYLKLAQLVKKFNKCRDKVKKQRASLRAAKNIISNPAFLNAVENLPSTAKILTLLQFRELKKKDKGRRFSIDEKIMGLSIFKQSPKCYRFLRKYFILPTPRTLGTLIGQADVRPGINIKIFSQLKAATKNMKNEEKLCVVLFDEMSLRSHITYNERLDKIIGFVTDGKSTKTEYADHVQVFMIRGLVRNYKKAVSYTFSAASTKGPELAVQLKEIIENLQEAGFIVVATVCDQGTNNRQALKLLLSETRGTLLRAGKEANDNLIIINDQKIVPLYDAPHLLKCIRNNLITKNLQYRLNNEIRTAKWEHIELLHKENPGYKAIRLIPKLTDNHVVPKNILKMKVKYASQLFSRTVASNMGYLAEKGILPKDCMHTADILLFFDNLFDSVNGSYTKKAILHGKPLLGPVQHNTNHHKTWRDAKILLNTAKFINKTTGKPESVPTLSNWVWTLDGIQVLLANLKTKYGITSVWMRHLNQDPLENFFGAIRSHGCRNVNPTPEQFQSAFVTLLINNMSSIHAPGANCEEDYCKALESVIISDEHKATLTCDLERIPEIAILDIQEKEKDPRVKGALDYVSGYFARCAKNKIFKNCKECTANIISTEENQIVRFREFAGKRWLCSPTESLIHSVSAVQDITATIFKHHLEINNIKELIKTIILLHLDFSFFKCNLHSDKLTNYFVSLSSRFFIYNHTKNMNKILSGKRDCDDNEDLFQMKAKKHFHKCFKRCKINESM